MNNGLSGHRRVIYDEVKKLILMGLPVSYAILSERANCDMSTVYRSMRDLRAWGLIEAEQSQRGKRGVYRCLD